MNLRLLLGLAVGYVLGARAGRERYDQMVQALNRSQLVQQARTELAKLRGSAGATADSGDAGMVTPPVVVGPGPQAPGAPPARSGVVLPDPEPSTAGHQDTPGTAGQATRIPPPSGI